MPRLPSECSHCSQPGPDRVSRLVRSEAGQRISSRGINPRGWTQGARSCPAMQPRSRAEAALRRNAKVRDDRLTWALRNTRGARHSFSEYVVLQAFADRLGPSSEGADTVT